LPAIEFTEPKRARECEKATLARREREYTSVEAVRWCRMQVVDMTTTRWSGPVKALLFAFLLVGVAGFDDRHLSMALFTAQVTNPGNTFQAGTLRMSNSRSGQAVFTTSGAPDGVATSTMSVVAASGTTAYVLGPVGAVLANPLPTDTGFQVPGAGGAMPGMVLVNSVTIGNVGTLAAGVVNLSVPSITMTNNAPAHCDASNALVVNGVDTCGRGRLTDVMRLTAYYLTGDGKAVCVIGSQTGSVVTAVNDGQAIMACGMPATGAASPSFGVMFGIPITRNAANLAGGAFALADSTAPLTIPIATTTGDRIDPLFGSVPVLNYRSGVAVRDWGAGETRAITFALSLDPGADNRYQGARASIDLRWDSTSLSGANAGVSVVVPPGVPVVGTSSITGTLTGPSGPLGSQQVALYPTGVAAAYPMGATPTYTTSGADGGFSFATVAPGTYSVVAWVDGVPVVRMVTTATGQPSNVALAASAVNRQLAVTMNPAPSAGSPWAATVNVSGSSVVSATSTFEASFGAQPTVVASGSFTVGYRSADAANSTLNVFTGPPESSTPPTIQYTQSLSDGPTTLALVVPTVTVTDFTCAATTCTAAVTVTGAPTGAVVNADLVSSGANASTFPATTLDQTAGASVALSFARPVAGTYGLRIRLSLPGAATPSGGWAWMFRIGNQTVAALAT
jgi:hypothetical protein